MSNADKQPGRVRSRSYDLLLLLLANAIWGSTDVAAKFAVAEMSPQAVAWTRFTIALIAFSPVLYLRRRELPRTVSGFLPFVALGACGFFLNFVLHYYGLRLAPASHATALRILESLAIVFLSVLFLRERVSRRAGVGLVLGLIGVAFIVDFRLGDLSLFKSGYRLGDLLIIGGVLVEGMYTVLGKKTLARTRPLTATALACVSGWVLLTAVSIPEIHATLVSPPSLTALLSCVYLGLFATAFGYTIWYRVLSRRESHRVGLTIMVQPAVGLPLAALVMKDSLPPVFLFGAALIALGVYLGIGPGTQKSAGSSPRG